MGKTSTSERCIDKITVQITPEIEMSWVSLFLYIQENTKITIKVTGIA